jgi:hypothetical protein
MKRGVIVGALLVVASPAQAVTGNDIYAWCTNPDDAPSLAMCAGFVQGISMSWTTAIGVLQEQGEDPARLLRLTFCPPAGHNLRQVIDIVVKYLEEYPEQRDRAGAFNILMALSEAWPCKGEQP